MQKEEEKSRLLRSGKLDEAFGVQARIDGIHEAMDFVTELLSERRLDEDNPNY